MDILKDLLEKFDFENVSKETIVDLLKTRLQRSALAAVICGILEDETENVADIKRKICVCFEKILDTGVYLGDHIDVSMAEACKRFLESEIALDEAKGIIKD